MRDWEVAQRRKAKEAEAIRDGRRPLGKRLRKVLAAANGLLGVSKAELCTRHNLALADGLVEWGFARWSSTGNVLMTTEAGARRLDGA